MRNYFYDMNNDPSRSFDPDPVIDDFVEDTESDDTSNHLYDEEFRRNSSSPTFPPTFDDEEEEDEDFNSQEFSALNQQLDQLQSALDLLESRNADIHSELLQLLQSNREVRRCITEELAAEKMQEESDVPEACGESPKGKEPSEKVPPVDSFLEKCSLKSD